VLVDPYEVPYAFTADGWRAVRDSLRRSDRDFQTADWVLGEQARLDIDRAQLESEVWSLYWADYVRHWRAFLDSATLVRFTGVQDAAQKLKTLTDNPSPLLQLLALASQNTAVESPIVKQAFQPVHLVMPPALKDRYVDSSNKAYMDALIGLSGIVQQAATTRSGEADGLVGPTLESTRSAAGVVRQLAQQFHTTPEAVPVGQAVRRLLEEPVSRVERMIVRMPAAAANARGASLCQRFAALKRKYPFSGNPGGPEATLDEVAGFFQPGSGALWQAYDQAWRNLLVQQGSAYAPAAGGSVTPTRAFVEFFNRAADFSAAVWPEGAAEATLGFRLRLRPTVAFPSATLNVDGRPYSFTQTDVASRTITWTGAGVSEVRLLVGIGRPGREVPVLEYGGTWALFKLFQRAQWRADGQRHILEWRVQVPQHPTPITLEGELTFNRAQPVLRAQWLERMTCVSQVVP
jgi:type VI secretion system protein ImpL